MAADTELLDQNPGHDDVLMQARQWQDAGMGVAIATVVSTWGSSPRPVGSQLVVNDQQDMVGSVSGGCVEGAVIEAAQQVMQAGTPKMLDFGVTNSQAWEVGLACGGKIEVYVEKLEAADEA
jgi:xanthine/CO dehydrogenase XdhC/CoxF family maturation factor